MPGFLIGTAAQGGSFAAMGAVYLTCADNALLLCADGVPLFVSF